MFNRKNGNLNNLFLLTEIVLLITTIFNTNSSAQAAIFFILSSFFFYKIRTDPPFLNEDISVLWLIWSTLFVWTGIMNIFSYVIKKKK